MWCHGGVEDGTCNTAPRNEPREITGMCVVIQVVICGCVLCVWICTVCVDVYCVCGCVLCVWMCTVCVDVYCVYVYACQGEGSVVVHTDLHRDMHVHTHTHTHTYTMHTHAPAHTHTHTLKYVLWESFNFHYKHSPPDDEVPNGTVLV